jgi:predicted aconitase
MKLQDDEKRILEGERGEGYRKAMEMLVALGDAFEAEKLIPIKRAHVALSGQEGDTYWCELLVNGGAVCAVPPSTNPCWDVENLSKVYDVSYEERDLALRTIDVYRRIGARLSFCCTPGLETNVPFFGEKVAFSESSATPYVNSVIGARSNRESSVSALAAAVIGKTPLYGYHLDENRKGDFLIDVEAELKDAYDWGILGYCVGKIAGSRNPVLRFKNDVSPGKEDLLYFGAEAATSGAVAMYHLAGITPEAPDAASAFADRRAPQAEAVITGKDLADMQEKISAGRGPVNLVMLGCPHYTYDQLREIETLFNGRRVHADTAFWVMAASAAIELAEKSYLRARLERLGVYLVGDTCIDEPCFKSFEGGLGVTDSPKCAYYRERRGQPFAIRRLSDCVEAAITGRVN